MLDVTLYASEDSRYLPLPNLSSNCQFQVAIDPTDSGEYEGGYVVTGHLNEASARDTTAPPPSYTVKCIDDNQEST